MLHGRRLLSLLLLATFTLAQEGVARPVAEEPRAVAVALVEGLPTAQPGPQHRWLQKLCGTFAVAGTTTVPGRPDQVAAGTATAKAILGGRYVVIDTVVELQGQRVESVLILGYDALRQRFTSSWRDDLSTWSIEGVTARDSTASSGAGTGQAPVEKITLAGLVSDVVTPTGRDFRMEVATVADGFSITVRDQLGSGEAVVMHWRFTAKPPATK